MLHVGDTLSDFRLQGTLNGETMSFDLESCKGQPVVLVFYPFAFTPV
jgi:peroxiredoxin